MKTIHIIALHLAIGGVEKAIINMANLFAERYDVEIISVYNMPGSPIYPLDKRVRVRYLLDDIPNRDEWKAAARNLKPGAFIRESIRSIKILHDKRAGVKRAIEGINDGIIITTRHEDNLLLSKYGKPGVLKIAQLHHDHNFEKKYVNAFKNSYDNIDYFTLLTPGLVEEVKEIMRGKHTKPVYIPNFLAEYPDEPDFSERSNVIIAVGRLNYVKRFDKLIRIFAAAHEKMPDWKLRIIGEGEERKKLEKIIDELKLSNCVTLVGARNAEGVEREMCSAGIYAMTSASEGFAFVIIEAQSCYLPTVSFDIRVGPPFLITNGKDGYIVPDNDDGAFADRLVELMQDSGKRFEMGKAARERSLDFSREKIAQLWYEILGD